MFVCSSGTAQTRCTRSTTTCRCCRHRTPTACLALVSTPRRPPALAKPTTPPSPRLSSPCQRQVTVTLTRRWQSQRMSMESHRHSVEENRSASQRYNIGMCATLSVAYQHDIGMCAILTVASQHFNIGMQVMLTMASQNRHVCHSDSGISTL